MTGNAGHIVRQLVDLCAQAERRDRVNVSYSIGDGSVSISFDPADLPLHPQRRRPVAAMRGQSLGIDLKPNWIGIAAAQNTVDPASLEETSPLELVKLDLAKDASPELVRETLAAVADRAISMARKHRCGTICVEMGLGKLRSSGRNRALNRLLTTGRGPSLSRS